MFAVAVLAPSWSAAPAAASLINLNFNGLSDGANNAAIQAHIQTQATLGGYGGTVTIFNARAERNYLGDNHVTGPIIGGIVNPKSLGTSDGGILHPGLDTFLINDGADRIRMVFTQPIFGIQFDYQIFPNGDVPNGNLVPPALYPDFTLIADGQTIFHRVAVMPGNGGIDPASPLANPELAPQYIGTTAFFVFPTGVTQLEFVDWPVMIGIDNLSVETQIPEPSTIFVLGAIAVTGAVFGRIRRFCRERHASS
jgi:hypothetical protein